MYLVQTTRLRILESTGLKSLSMQLSETSLPELTLNSCTVQIKLRSIHSIHSFIFLNSLAPNFTLGETPLQFSVTSFRDESTSILVKGIPKHSAIARKFEVSKELIELVPVTLQLDGKTIICMSGTSINVVLLVS